MSSGDEMDFTWTTTESGKTVTNNTLHQNNNAINIDPNSLNNQLVNLEKRCVSIGTTEKTALKLSQQQLQNYKISVNQNNIVAGNGSYVAASQLQQQTATMQILHKLSNNGTLKSNTQVPSSSKTKANSSAKIKNKNKRPRVALQENNNNISNITLTNANQSNRFALHDLEVSTVHDNNIAQGNTSKDNISDTNTSATAEETETRCITDDNEGKASQQRFLRPIVIYNVNIRAFIVEPKSKLPQLVFKIKNCSNTKSKLFVKNFDSYTRIMSILKEKGINSHSYTPVQSKQASLILSGIHFSTSAEEIKNELDFLMPNTIDSVHVFITP